MPFQLPLPERHLEYCKAAPYWCLQIDGAQELIAPGDQIGKCLRIGCSGEEIVWLPSCMLDAPQIPGEYLIVDFKAGSPEPGGGRQHYAHSEQICQPVGCRPMGGGP